MNACFIFVLTSITYAMKAERLLAAANIHARPIKTGEVIKVRGCGYGLYVKGDRGRARKILEENGIRILAETEASDI